MEVTFDEETCALWCMDVGLIDKHKRCLSCGSLMKPSLARKRWRCSRRTKHADGKEQSIGMLTCSCFNDAKLKLHRAVRILLAWTMRLSQAQAMEMAEASERTVRDCYAYCRGTCSKELLKTELKIGGDGHIVEIDETSLAKKRKYNRGRHYQEYWLFGGVESGAGRSTKIMSDLFATYVCERGNKQHTLENNRLLLSMSYTHSWVNLSLNFVDPVTGTHTYTIEGLWETRIKRHIKSTGGMTRTSSTPTWMGNMWRSWFFFAKGLNRSVLCWSGSCYYKK
ncbi:uncharacterized protein PITG_23305 [Phytophthora infestans T30-4]|uniref:ISXO2-like transposase domain-containing protein n=1 Tax=Phytophthora infestans (strain T30-4) TaxID=403677 RepID=D0N625_PHYIT|nr:uncharacterized protein PITG_23305 [Phytophthora infestans T30-4]EEY70516.1 hypothetical protein PITG_23305 [Phytophthora infestans T30-4]|eukprot:XP_002998170.1 hypothetical protein PITG_23305 [Phytophthora infestans T30-4]